MGKNDWANNQQMTRSSMNQPYCLISGTADGAGNVTLMASPGSIRYSSLTSPIYPSDPNGTWFTFQPQVNTNYVVYARQNGTLMVSGIGSNQPGTVRPGLPRFDAEPIGYVEVGASVITGNLNGPWNNVATSTVASPYEQRGQYNAIMTARQRNISQRYRTDATETTIRGGRISSAGGRQTYLSASGIAWLLFSDGNFLRDASTQLTATVTYVPSGALTGGVLYSTPTFVIWRGEDSQGASGGTSLPLGLFPYSQIYSIAQKAEDPTVATIGTSLAHTASFSVLVSGVTTIGYALGAYIDLNRSHASAIQVTSVDFRATPNIRNDSNADGS